MPKKLTLAQIARKNPHIDLEKLNEWTHLRKVLIQGGLRAARKKVSTTIEDDRARIVDDPEDDPRLIRLQR
jgi:hypothetical protein